MATQDNAEEKQVVAAMTVDEAEHVSLQLAPAEAAAPVAEAPAEEAAAAEQDAERPVHMKLKVDKAGKVHVALAADGALHHGKHQSWAKHQFKKLLNILTHKTPKKSKSKGDDTSSPADKTKDKVAEPAQSPATPNKAPFWRIGSKAHTPTAEQPEPAAQQLEPAAQQPEPVQA